MTEKRKVSSSAAPAANPRPALMAAMESLPGVETKRDRLDALASRLELTAVIMHVADLPGAKEAGSDTVRKRLERFVQRAREMNDDLLTMPRDALAVLETSPGRHWALVLDDVVQLGATAKAKIEKTGDNHSPGPKGRPRKEQAAAVALIAKGAFRVITGQAPSVGTADGRAYGPYLDFVAAIFKAFGIDASAEVYARNALKEKTTSKSGQ